MKKKIAKVKRTTRSKKNQTQLHVKAGTDNGWSEFEAYLRKRGN